MAEYINKRDALKIMRDAWDIYENGDFAISEAIRCVESLPAADVVEIVRCKNCVHYDGRLCHNPNTFDDEKTAGNTTDMWYCADGEKKNG